MHENKKYRRLLYILSNVALGLCFVLFVPFGSMIGKAEALIKFIIIPIAILIINAIITVKKFEDYRPSSRFLSFVSYLPMFAFTVTYSAYLILISNRTEPTAVFEFEKYIIIITALTAFAVFVMIALFNLEKLNIKLSKNQINFIDVVIYIDYICFVVFAKQLVADKYVGIEMFNTSGLIIFVGLLIGGAIIAILCLRNKNLYVNNAEFIHCDKTTIIDEWNKLHDDAYFNGELLILLALKNYEKERLVFEENEKVSLPSGAVAVDKNELNSLEEELKKLRGFKEAYAKRHDKLKKEYFELQNQVKVDVTKTEIESLEKQIALLDASIEEENARVVEDIKQYEEEKAQFDEKKLQFESERNVLLGELNVTSFAEFRAKEEAEKAAAEARAQERAEARAKAEAEKVFIPTYEEVLSLAKAIKGEDIESSVNPTGTTYKFTTAGKMFLTIQKTSSDYRVTFSVLEEDIMENMRKYPGVISMAKSPKVGNFLQLVNKGEFDTEVLTSFINNSLDCYKDAERRIAEAKEAEKQAKQEAKEQEKRNKELLKEAEKIVAKARKEEEKAAKEAEKAAQLEEASNEEAA